jgi:hypothetical protein
VDSDDISLPEESFRLIPVSTDDNAIPPQALSFRVSHGTDFRHCVAEAKRW